MRIAARTKHPHQALGRSLGGFAELFESNRRFDVIAQHGLTGIDIASEQGVDTFTQEVFREGGVGLLVTKNSGGPMTAAKLTAARDLGVLVVMVRRPPLPPDSMFAATVPEALRWLEMPSGPLG